MTAFLSPTVILPPPRKTIPRQSTLHVLHPWERKRADNLIPGSAQRVPAWFSTIPIWFSIFKQLHLELTNI